MKCPFCKVPCNNPECAYKDNYLEQLDEQERWVKTIIRGANHACYQDRIRILNNIRRLRETFINQQQKK